MFESVNSVSRYDMVRQTVPDGYYPVSEVKLANLNCRPTASDSDSGETYFLKC